MLPLRIEGPMLGPSIYPDLDRLSADEILREKAEDEVRGLLDRLLRRGDDD